MAHIREFHLGERGSRKKNGLLAWVTFCVTLRLCIDLEYARVLYKSKWEKEPAGTKKYACLFQSN